MIYHSVKTAVCLYGSTGCTRYSFQRQTLIIRNIPKVYTGRCSSSRSTVSKLPQSHVSACAGANGPKGAKDGWLDRNVDPPVVCKRDYNSQAPPVILRVHLAGRDPADYPVKILIERGTFSPSPRCCARGRVHSNAIAHKLLKIGCLTASLW